MVARSAQNELGDLDKELAQLRGAISLLVEELENPQSTLRTSGEARIQMVIQLKDYTNDTLTKLQKLADKHHLAKSPDSGFSLRSALRKTKFVKDASDISKLRSKLVYHYSTMQLLLTSAGNSSLERIQTNNETLTANVEEIKNMLQGLTVQNRESQLDSKNGDSSQSKGFNPNGRHDPDLAMPDLSTMDTSDVQESMSNLFMYQAEIRGSWASIGIQEWIQAGNWWYLKAKLTWRSPHALGEKSYNQSFVNLLKAAWIVGDIVEAHPHRIYALNTQSDQQPNVQVLSAVVKKKLKQWQESGQPIPSFSDMEKSDFSIWNFSSTTSSDLDAYKNLPTGLIVVGRLPETTAVFSRIGRLRWGDKQRWGKNHSINCVIRCLVNISGTNAWIYVQNPLGLALHCLSCKSSPDRGRNIEEETQTSILAIC